jgi:hypothetical protein
VLVCGLDSGQALCVLCVLCVLCGGGLARCYSLKAWLFSGACSTSLVNFQIWWNDSDSDCDCDHDRDTVTSHGHGIYLQYVCMYENLSRSRSRSRPSRQDSPWLSRIESQGSHSQGHGHGHSHGQGHGLADKTFLDRVVSSRRASSE